ncbi:uncharacterized protein LOC121929965 isoform X2 [Sceloporus undulatus]|uniref:uncharacterized protein LOC121929965 isoform X2 n=1 Tax=Sceloporus undulatus TaxID=8520 RepID=UPI001C4B8855|nr:uncharacterized protein LOC121929965 isoform X2 [Sceloporus undulatus]
MERKKEAMAFIFWIGLWSLLQLTEASITSPPLPNCSTAKDEALLPSPNKTVLRRDPHLRREEFLECLYLELSCG